MPQTRLLPALPPPGRHRSWTIVVSVLLHVLLLAAVLLFTRKPPEEGGGAPSYDLVFEGPAGTPPPGTPDAAAAAPESAPVPQAAPPPAAPAQPDAPAGPPTPAPLAPPVPDAAPPAPPPVAPSIPVPNEAPPAPAPPAAPLPAPAQPVPVTPEPSPLAAAPEPTAPSAPAAVRLEAPQEEQRPASPAPIMPQPPPPLPAPRPPAPPPAFRPRSAPPPGSFSNPMDLSFAGPQSRPGAPRIGAPRGSVASRSLDLSPGSSHTEPTRQDAFFDARAAAAGQDWKDGLMSYWLKHRYYPRQAAEAGEDGRVEIEMTVNQFGKVTAVSVKSQSGSPWLDMAALATWRGAQLAPLPATAGDHLTFSISINYMLLR